MTRVARAVLLFAIPEAWRAASFGASDARVLAWHKLSAGPTPLSQAFELVVSSIPAVESVLTVSPSVETDLTARRLFEGLDRAEDVGGEIEAAVTFVLNFLADGPQPSKALREAAEEASISWRTIERARAKLRDMVEAYQEKGAWWLRLRSIPDTLPEVWP